MNDAAPLSASKKCPHCGFWSPWQQKSDDTCARCGQLLDPVRNRSEQARDQESKQPMSQFMLLEISPDDKGLVRLGKQLIRGGQLAFAATLSFILWFLALAAG
ncbi:hypothetical protein [Hymenobacter cellulosivorans]|uniref:DUF983 domain-containing protein n=1 Tax=Hymenobacter cellulosivorans TaxID=2932249 RepID=A0ABY4F793_9BACT|nr:hypothetical protein [Hymenobacter cellulosivorans]UOQ51972.1 hypothetical protein MUN80_19685 [Hymenobacter cellulosivorans]